MSRDNIAAARETTPDLEGYNYYILKSQDPELLSARVQAFIDNGWRVCGGLSAATEGDSVAYAQAMVKDHDPLP